MYIMNNKKYLTNPPHRWIIILWCLFCLFLTWMGYLATGKYQLIWSMTSFLLLFDLLLIYTYWNYPILHKERIEIKNLIGFSFNFKYESINKIEIMNSARGPIIIIRLKDKCWSRRFCIDCVNNNDLDKLSVELQQKGVNTIRKMNPFD